MAKGGRDLDLLLLFLLLVLVVLLLLLLFSPRWRKKLKAVIEEAKAWKDFLQLNQENYPPRRGKRESFLIWMKITPYGSLSQRNCRLFPDAEKGSSFMDTFSSFLSTFPTYVKYYIRTYVFSFSIYYME
jgi:predicted PurR-regulated permease PerM